MINQQMASAQSYVVDTTYAGTLIRGNTYCLGTPALDTRAGCIPGCPDPHTEPAAHGNTWVSIASEIIGPNKPLTTLRLEYMREGVKRDKSEKNWAVMVLLLDLWNQKAKTSHNAIRTNTANEALDKIIL